MALLGNPIQGLVQEINRVTLALVEDVRRRIVVSMRGRKTGRIYKRGGTVHQASAPGEAPAIDKGTLVNSIEVGSDGRGKYRLTIGAKQAEGLEKGTRKVAARRFVEPAIVKTVQAFSGRRP